MIGMNAIEASVSFVVFQQLKHGYASECQALIA
jgi:hypothetical protein